MLLRIILAFALAAPSLFAEAPLADAAEQQQWSRLPALLDAPDAAQEDGTTALHWAAYHDQPASVKRLLEAGAQAAVKNRYGETPLGMACRNGSADVVRQLLDAGAEVDGTLSGGETMLMVAARTGKPGPVAELIKRDANIHAKDRRGQTALMWAAAEGNTEAVRLLVDAGAKVEESLKSGFNAWFFAAREGRDEVVQLFLKSGCDVNTAMRVERGGGRAPRKRMSALMLAMENGHFELAARLLAAGADANDQRSGFAPLHALSWVRKPNRGDGIDGTPPPRVFGSMTSLQFVDRLVEHGAEVNLPLKRSGTINALGLKGATPMLLAAKTADLALLKKLHAHGADPLKSNESGTTPFMAAAGLGTRNLEDGEPATEQEALAAAAYLMELGAEVNTVNKKRETAMHGAAYSSFPGMVRFLAANGAEVKTWNIKGKGGWTPLLIAQGFRPGNFKPSADTIDAISEVMRAAGLTPPPAPPRPVVGKPKKYEKP